MLRLVGQPLRLPTGRRGACSTKKHTLMYCSQRTNKWLCLTRSHVRKCIRLVLETARPYVKERRQPETYCARQQRKQQHRRDNIHCQEASLILETKRAIKPLLTRQPRDRGERHEHTSNGNTKQLQYVALFVMADFMRKHRFQFRLVELRDECVEEDDFSKSSEPGEERIGVARAFAAVHHIDAARGKICALRQCEKAPAQRSLRQRCELVEQRHDYRRRDQQQEQLKRDDNCRSPEPPVCTSPLDQFQDQRHQRVAEQQREQKSFYAIDHPRLHRGGVETESFFEFELCVPGERQCEDAQRDARNQEETGHCPDRRAEVRREFSKCPWQHAAEKHCDEQQEIERTRDFAEAALGEGVINRTTIGRFVNDFAKCRRHFIRIRAHVTLVQPAQTQFSDGARQN